MFYFLILVIVYVGLSQSEYITEILHPPPCELRDAYGYDNIPDTVHYHDWVLASGPSSPDGTGPSANRANEADGCYLLHQTANTSPDEFSILVSPCYIAVEPANGQPLLRFFHFTNGRDVGSLVAYLRLGCLNARDWTLGTVYQLPKYKIWEITERQNKSWTEVQLPLDISQLSAPSFQIVFEVFAGNGDIALDEISISGIECYSEGGAKFLCDNSSCIPGLLVCDSQPGKGDVPDCIDGTDEPAPRCCNPYTEFMCDNGRCIDVEKRCDGANDCTSTGSGEDEDNCPGSSKNPSMSITPTTMETVTEMSMTTLTTPMTTEKLLTDFGETPYNAISDTTRKTSFETSVTTINNAKTVDMGFGVSTTIAYDEATKTTGKSGTFCETNMIIPGLDNCSFIGLIVALGLIFIVFAIWIITRIINRCLDNPQGRKSRAVSKTENSLVPDNPEWDSNTGQDNKATTGETMSQTTNENDVAVIVDDMHSTTTMTKVTSNGTASDRVLVVDETTREEGSENLEMKMMNVIIDDKDRKKGDIIEEVEKNHTDEAPSAPVYAVPDKSRNSDLIKDSSTGLSARKNSYEDVDMNRKVKTPSAPVYAKPDQSRKSNVIQDPLLDRSARDNSYEDVDMYLNEQTSPPAENSTPESRKSNFIPDQKPDLITPYAETEINAGSAHKPATSSEGNNGIPLYSMPDKRKSSQASTNSMGLDGYSKVQSKPVDESDMYEEVKVGNMDKVTESRRPTLPEGHPSLRPMSKVELQTDSKSAGANSLPVIDENHNADIGLYAEANFDSTESVTEQAKDKGNTGVVETDKDEKRNEEADNGDQTEWVDNIVYARTSVGT